MKLCWFVTMDGLVFASELLGGKSRTLNQPQNNWPTIQQIDGCRRGARRFIHLLNVSGASDGSDSLAWQRQFGSPGAASLASSCAVPEPTGAILLLVTIACSCTLRG